MKPRTCRRCGQRGHNVRTCREPEPVYKLERVTYAGPPRDELQRRIDALNVKLDEGRAP